MQTVPDFSSLNNDGLNMQAVFNLADLPKPMHATLAAQIGDVSRYRQLILLAHGGTRMWQAVQASEFRTTADPVDNFSMHCLQRWFAESTPGTGYAILFPAPHCSIDLQALGRLAGWHHPSPFRIGIHPAWGTWFAYRAVALSDSNLQTTERIPTPSPCDSCEAKPCLTACPACGSTDGPTCGPNSAPDRMEIALRSCIDYRLEADSRCRSQCLARLACPVGTEHRYSPEQLHYHYDLSLQTIRKHFGISAPSS